MILSPRFFRLFVAHDETGRRFATEEPTLRSEGQYDDASRDPRRFPTEATQAGGAHVTLTWSKAIPRIGLGMDPYLHSVLVASCEAS